MSQTRPIKVLLAKSGLDGHDRGVNVISQGLMENGMEVIYLGLRQTPEKIVTTALEEDVNVIGLSSLSGGHNVFLPKVVKLAKEKGLDNTLIIGGGIINEEDADFLKSQGVSAVFGPGSSIKDITDYIRNNVKLQ